MAPVRGPIPDKSAAPDVDSVTHLAVRMKLFSNAWLYGPCPAVNM